MTWRKINIGEESENGWRWLCGCTWGEIRIKVREQAVWTLQAIVRHWFYSEMRNTGGFKQRSTRMWRIYGSFWLLGGHYVSGARVEAGRLVKGYCRQEMVVDCGDNTASSKQWSDLCGVWEKRTQGWLKDFGPEHQIIWSLWTEILKAEQILERRAENLFRRC